MRSRKIRQRIMAGIMAATVAVSAMPVYAEEPDDELLLAGDFETGTGEDDGISIVISPEDITEDTDVEMVPVTFILMGENDYEEEAISNGYDYSEWLARVLNAAGETAEGMAESADVTETADTYEEAVPASSGAVTLNGQPCGSIYDAVFTADNGSTVRLEENVMLDSPLQITKNITIDLNGHSISNTVPIWDTAGQLWSLLCVNGGTLTLTGNGTVKPLENDCYCIDVRNGGRCVIENGTYSGNISTVYVYEGELVVNGGDFSLQQLSGEEDGNDTRYMLNCYNRNYDNGTASIKVYGGAFHGWNPADNMAEGEHTDFVVTDDVPEETTAETAASDDTEYTETAEQTDAGETAYTEENTDEAEDAENFEETENEAGENAENAFAQMSEEMIAEMTGETSEDNGDTAEETVEEALEETVEEALEETVEETTEETVEETAEDMTEDGTVSDEETYGEDASEDAAETEGDEYDELVRLRNKPGFDEKAARAWHKNDDETWDYELDGKTYRDEWAYLYNPYADTDSGQPEYSWFHFDADGTMTTGWFTDSDGYVYYLNPISDNTKGMMVTGSKWIDNGDGTASYYYFDEEENTGHFGGLVPDALTPEGFDPNWSGEWTIDGEKIIRQRKKEN